MVSPHDKSWAQNKAQEQKKADGETPSTLSLFFIAALMAVGTYVFLVVVLSLGPK